MSQDPQENQKVAQTKLDRMGPSPRDMHPVEVFTLVLADQASGLLRGAVDEPKLLCRALTHENARQQSDGQFRLDLHVPGEENFLFK